MPKMYTGNVVEPGPATKKEVIKSSIDIANASKAPAKIAGANSGKVILRKI